MDEETRNAIGKLYEVAPYLLCQRWRAGLEWREGGHTATASQRVSPHDLRHQALELDQTRGAAAMFLTFLGHS